MDAITKNKMDHLAMKVHMHLLQEAKAACAKVAGADSLTERELEAIYERAVTESGVEARLRLHAEVWVDDVSAKAKQLANAAADGKVKRAANLASSRRRTPTF
jgi:hypothetical protein